MSSHAADEVFVTQPESGEFHHSGGEVLGTGSVRSRIPRAVAESALLEVLHEVRAGQVRETAEPLAGPEIVEEADHIAEVEDQDWLFASGITLDAGCGRGIREDIHRFYRLQTATR